MNSVSDTSNPLKRVAVVGTGLGSAGSLNAKTPGRYACPRGTDEMLIS